MQANVGENTTTVVNCKALPITLKAGGFVGLCGVFFPLMTER